MQHAKLDNKISTVIAISRFIDVSWLFEFTNSDVANETCFFFKFHNNLVWLTYSYPNRFLSKMVAEKRLESQLSNMQRQFMVVTQVLASNYMKTLNMSLYFHNVCNIECVNILQPKRGPRLRSIEMVFIRINIWSSMCVMFSTNIFP